MLFICLSSLSFFSPSCSSMRIPFEARAELYNEATLSYQEGQKLEAEEKYEQAVLSYEKALSFPKIRDSALFRMGRCASLCEDWTKAEESFLRLLKDDEGNTAVRQSLAYVYCQSGRIEEGLNEYRALHEEKPHDESIYKGYIKALRLNNLDEEADREEEAFTALFPPHLMSK